MKNSYKKALTAFVTFIGGLYFFLEYMLPKKLGDALPNFAREALPEGIRDFQIGALHQEFTNAVILVGAMAIGLGIVNLVRVHGNNILKNRKDKWNSAALLIGMVTVMLIEGADFLVSEEQGLYTQQIIQIQKFHNKVKKEHSFLSETSVEDISMFQDKLLSEKHGLQNILEKISEDGNLYSCTTQKDEAYNSYCEKLKSSLNWRISGIDQVNRGDAQEVLDNHLELISQVQHATDDQYFGDLLELSREIWKSNRDSLFSKKASDFVFYAFFVPLGSAMFSLLAFYVATAAYRTFRIKTVETSLMMLGALVVMLGQIPLGPLYIYDGLPQMRLWIMEYMSTPASRAIAFGSLIAGLAMAIRMWLSLEVSPLGAEGEGDAANGGGK